MLIFSLLQRSNEARSELKIRSSPNVKGTNQFSSTTLLFIKVLSIKFILVFVFYYRDRTIYSSSNVLLRLLCYWNVKSGFFLCEVYAWHFLKNLYSRYTEPESLDLLYCSSGFSSSTKALRSLVLKPFWIVMIIGFRYVFFKSFAMPLCAAIGITAWDQSDGFQNVFNDVLNLLNSIIESCGACCSLIVLSNSFIILSNSM